MKNIEYNIILILEHKAPMDIEALPQCNVYVT